MIPKTTHTPDTLAALDNIAIRALYRELTGARPGRRPRDTLVAAILEIQAETPAEPAATDESTSTAHRDTLDPASGPVRLVGFACEDPEPATEPAAEPEPDPGAARDARLEGDPTTAPIPEPARVRLTGYGAYEGSEMTCPLLTVTPVAAEVQVVDARIRFDLETGRGRPPRGVRAPIRERRSGWLGWLGPSRARCRTRWRTPGSPARRTAAARCPG